MNVPTSTTEPTMTPVTKIPALMSSVNIISRSSSDTTIEVNMSGAPLPKARIVTPAMLSDRYRIDDITDRFGTKLRWQNFERSVFGKILGGN